MASRLKKTLLYTYGTADLGFVLIANMESYFFPAFLTDYAGFSIVVVGQILWLTSLVDILCALAAGIILHKITLRFGGKYRSWFLVAPPLIAVLFVLQFTKIGDTLVAASIIIFGFVASHLLWNVVFTASASMVGRLSQHSDERTILSTSRAQGMSAAGLIMSITALPMILYFGKHTDEVTAFTIVAGIFAVFMVLGYWYIYWMTAGRDPYDEKTSGLDQAGTRETVREIVGLVFRNPPLMFLIVAEMFRNTQILVIAAFAYYYFAYVLDNLAYLSVFILAISLARLFGTFAATWFGLRFGKVTTYWLFLLLAAAVFVSASFLGHSELAFTLLFSLGSLLGMVAGAMSTALFSDTVIYGEWKTGSNIRAFTMALQSLPIKVAILIRSAAITVGLLMIGFVANTEPGQGVIDGIRHFMIFTPAIACALGAMVFYYGYRIQESQVPRMLDEIAAR